MKPWKDWFQPHILDRGRAYFDEGWVSALERTKDNYADLVEKFLTARSARGAGVPCLYPAGAESD